MTSERAAEIRALAARLAAGKRHRKIAAVLAELLAEIDRLDGYLAELRREVGEWEERYYDSLEAQDDAPVRPET